ncbi:hypothetical protein ACFWPK_05865 [Nocardia sp. NPDC058519]|uniref:hypothetical protein n=1 Tax=Nocardia sp. NPDC058519 TaxID=3346535 RepID=UPI00364DB05C
MTQSRTWRLTFPSRMRATYQWIQAAHEVGRGCGFDTDFPGRPGEFVVWGSARDQVDGCGNAVSPAVGAWIGQRLPEVLHTAEAIV